MAEPRFVLNSQYIRDLSFEVPKAPLVFAMLQEKQPEIKISVDVQVQNLHEKLFEVVLKTETNCSVGDTVAFILEIAYAGLFTLNVPKEEWQRTLLVDCPTLLFPFVRYLMADLTREGGFPPVMMGLVDFENMFKQQQQSQTQAGPTATA
jgi:preprotein translocase subunit SecB